jgi:hypothetical protein
MLALGCRSTNINTHPLPKKITIDTAMCGIQIQLKEPFSNILKEEQGVDEPTLAQPTSMLGNFSEERGRRMDVL